MMTLLNKIFNFGKTHWHLILLAMILFLALNVRMQTYSDTSVLTQADTWFFLRKANETIENNYRVPSWDIYSHFPPGRPSNRWFGYEYGMAIIYLPANFFGNLTIMQVANIMPVLMILLSVVIAYFLGKFFSNKWGGIATALFVAFSPAVLTLSMAGYSDSDVVVVFFTLLCTLTLFYAFKKRNILSYCLAIIANILFVISWIAGWYVILLFSALLVLLIVVNIILKNFKEAIGLLKVLVIIFVPVFLISFLIGFNIFTSVLERFGWFRGEMLVNISVAELQRFNLLSRLGIEHISSRVGTLPFLLTILGLPIIIALRFYKKSKPSEIEIFLFILIIFTTILVTTGTRFVLLLTMASIIFAGYVVGKVVEYLPKEDILKIVAYGTILILSFSMVSNAYAFILSGRPSDNWFDAMDWLKKNADKDSLVVTWWDPGHFIVYTTGLKVHADGAQCPNYECVIYDHNVRIQDMGRIFTTDDEEEAMSILEKYIQLTPEQCQEIKQRFGDIVPDDVCKPVSEMYLIASNDLIGKYYWMSFFGDCLKKFGLQSADVCYKTPLKWFEENAQGRNFIQLSLSRQDAQGNLIYGEIVTLTVKDDQLIPILNIPQQGIRNAVIKEIIYYQNGQESKFEYTNVTNTIDGLLWVHPDMRSVIFMDSTIRDSLFTRMFFFEGKDLKHFELKYFDPEVRIYKVVF